MTKPAPDTRDKFFVTDEELIALMGVPEQQARAIIRELDERFTGFPKKQKMFCDRRYLPAVKSFFDKLNGVESQIGAARVAPESPNRSGPPRRSPTEPIRRATP